MDQYLNELWLNFHKALLNYIKKNLGNPEDAEDILQNVFVKILSNIDKLKDKEKVTPWMYRITRNTIIDSYRAGERPLAQPLPLLDETASLAGNEPDESWKTEVTGLLMEMVNELPDKYRDVLQWYEFEGLTHREIASRLGVTVSGSKTRVQRSREKLKEMLICGCRAHVEIGTQPKDSGPPLCDHLLKMGPLNVCVKRLPNPNL